MPTGLFGWPSFSWAEMGYWSARPRWIASSLFNSVQVGANCSQQTFNALEKASRLMLIGEVGIPKSLGSGVEGRGRSIGAVRGGASCSWRAGGTVAVMWRRAEQGVAWQSPPELPPGAEELVRVEGSPGGDPMALQKEEQRECVYLGMLVTLISYELQHRDYRHRVESLEFEELLLFFLSLV